LWDTQPQTAANYGIFFIARHPCEVLFISEVHGTAGTDAGAVTLQVEKLTGTTAKGAGTNILATTINLKGTSNTVQTREITGLVRTGGVVSLRKGDRLALKSSGTLTDLKDVQVTVYLKPSGKGDYR
jgi:hypothetical protein